MRKTHKILISLLIITLLGGILRLIVASNVSVLADEMIHGVNAINIIHSGVLNIQNEGPVWSYVTDVFYRFFGVGALSSRSMSIIFGIFTIPLIYLIAKDLFNDEKIAIVSSLLLAISAYTIRYTLMEHDISMMFFILISFYFFQKELREKKTISNLSVVFLGVALLIKPIAITFVPSFVLAWFMLCDKKDRHLTLKKKSKILEIIAILFILISPILVHNYISYEQRGVTDVIFSRFLKINQEVYAPLQGYDQGFSISYLFKEGIPAIAGFVSLDPIIWVLGIIGIAFIFKRKERLPMIFCSFHAITFVFLLGTSLLQTHFVSFLPLLSLSASFLIVRISELGEKKINNNVMIVIFIILIAVLNIFLIWPNLTSKSAIFQMRSYAAQSISDNSIVVADGRIYRGRIAWMFNDKAYLESTLFSQLIELSNKTSTEKIPIDVYFVECIPDDCGWGTISSQPDFNSSTEDIVSLFKNNFGVVKTINGGGGYDEVSNKPYFTIYKATLSLSSEVFPAVYETHDWFYYPVRWEKSDWYDKYTPNGFFQQGIYSIGKIALWISIVLVLLSPFLIVFELMKKF